MMVNCCSSLMGQDKSKNLIFSIGRSFHGTGDLTGFSFDIGYQKFPRKTFGYEVSFVSTFHFRGSEDDFLPSNEQLYFVTSGFQTGFRGVLSVFSNDVHRMQVGVGSLLRYEMSSYPNSYGTYPYLLNPSSPTPVYAVTYDNPNNRITVGYSVTIRYLVNLSEKNSIGFGIGFQNDTIGSTITILSFIYSRSLCSEK